MTQHDAIDGRAARRLRNREQVIDAMLDAIERGDAVPTIKQVAELSGVSERSVFRYFSDIEELLGAAVERAQERYRDSAVIANEGRGSLDERLDALIEARVRLWVRAAPAADLIRSREHREPVLSAGIVSQRLALRAQLENHLAGLFDDMEPSAHEVLLDVIEVNVSYESFRFLVGSGVSSDGLRQRWRLALRSAVAGAGG